MKLKRYTSHLTISSDDNNIEKQKKNKYIIILNKLKCPEKVPI